VPNNAASIGSGYGPVAVDLDPLDDLTIMFWMRFDDEPGQTFTLLAFLYVLAASGTANYLQFYSGDGATALRELWADWGANYFGSGEAPAVGTWVHVAISYTAGTNAIRYVINGTEEITDTVTGGFNVLLDTFALGDTTGSNSTPISVRSLKMFQKAMTDGEITTEMASIPVVGSDIVHWFDLNGGTDLTDAITGTATFVPTVDPSEDPTQSVGFFALAG
jgi:hypothetical protein